MGALDGIDAEQAERIRQELTSELRQTLTDEISVQVRERITDEVRAGALREFERERLARAPSDEDRARFLSYVREVQLDSLAQASVATGHAAQSQRMLRRSRGIAMPAMYAATIALPLVTTSMVSWFGGQTVWTLAAIGTFVIAWLSLISSSVRRHATLDTAARASMKVASDYLVLAERAKAYRMVHAERLDSAKELHELLEAIRIDKERLDAATHLDMTEIEQARAAEEHKLDDLGEANRLRLDSEPRDDQEEDVRWDREDDQEVETGDDEERLGDMSTGR